MQRRVCSLTGRGYLRAYRVRRYLSTVAGILGVLGAGPARGQQPRPGVTILSQDLEVEQLAANVWRHVSYQELAPFGRSPANGLIVVVGGDAILVDTPWTDAQTATLFEWVSAELGARISTVVPTHSHPDNLGGLGEAHRRGAVSVAFEKTVASARERGVEVPEIPVSAAHDLTLGNLHLELRFFGGGHTADNIVVWIPERNILFGGCVVRAAAARTLGWTEEAVLESWPSTIRAILREYAGEHPTVVPGHGAPGGVELLEHTLQLLENRARQPH